MKRILVLLLALLGALPASAEVVNGYLKRAALENLSADPSTTLTGRVYWNSSTNQAKVYNGTAWAALGSGAGSGEKNYLSNGSSSNVGWTPTSGVTCTQTTTSVPDPSIGTALAVTGSSGSTGFCYATFTIDDADFNKKLKLAFDQYDVSAVSGDFRVDVCSCSVAFSGGACNGGTVAQGCGTNATRIPLSTDSSNVSALPALTGTYRTTFDAPGSVQKYIQVQVGLNSTNTHQINLANIIAGPGVVTQGAVATQWQSFTPTGSWTTNTTYTGWYRRVGDSIQERIHIALSGAPNASTTLLVNNPSGLTTNTSALQSNATSVGSWNSYHSATLAVNTGTVQVSTGNNVSLDITASGGSSNYLVGTTAPVTWASGDQIDFDATIPVNEYAGSGTVNVAQDDVEYAYNSSTNDADDTTSFAYGPGGTTFAPMTALRKKRVRFLSPIQATDRIAIELEDSTTGAWLDISYTGYRSGIGDFQWQNGVSYGIGIDSQSTGVATDVDVIFGQYAYPSGATYGAAGPSWSAQAGSQFRWRLKKIKGGAAVGFGLASATASGLVSYEDSGTLTATASGAQSGSYTLYYSRVGKAVTINWPTLQSLACSAATLALSGIPSSIQPARTTYFYNVLYRNSGTDSASSGLVVASGSSLTFETNGQGAFASGTSGSCGPYSGSISYTVQ